MDHGLVMGFVMIKQITKDVTLMVGIVVDHVLLKVTVQNVHVSNLMLMNLTLQTH